MTVTWEVRSKLKYIGKWKMVRSITDDAALAYKKAGEERDYLASRWWGGLFDWILAPHDLP